MECLHIQYIHTANFTMCFTSCWWLHELFYPNFSLPFGFRVEHFWPHIWKVSLPNVEQKWPHHEAYTNRIITLTVYEPWHDKTNKMSVRPAKTQISLDIHSVWSESSLSAWRNLGSLATHWADSEDSDQTGHTLILLVLSCRDSFSLGSLWIITVKNTKKIYTRKYCFN